MYLLPLFFRWIERNAVGSAMKVVVVVAAAHMYVLEGDGVTPHLTTLDRSPLASPVIMSTL